MVTSAEKNKIWRRNNPEKQMLRGVGKRVREKGYETDLELVDIVIPSHCPLLGVELKIGGGDFAPTLDRIATHFFSYMGGTPPAPSMNGVAWRFTLGQSNQDVDNNRANRMKSDATLEELIRVRLD